MTNQERALFRRTLTVEEKLYLLLITPNQNSGIMAPMIKSLKKQIEEIEHAIY